MENGKRQETTIEKYSICDLRIGNSQQHLIMWLYCLCEANVKPHSIIIYLGQPACVLLLSIAMFCSFLHFKYSIAGLFSSISHSLLSFWSTMDLFIAPFDCTQCGGFFYHKDTQTLFGAQLLLLFTKINIFVIIACNTIIRFSISLFRFPVDRILETGIEFPNIAKVISGTSAITFGAIFYNCTTGDEEFVLILVKGHFPKIWEACRWMLEIIVMCQRTMHKMHKQ